MSLAGEDGKMRGAALPASSPDENLGITGVFTLIFI